MQVDEKEIVLYKLVESVYANKLFKKIIDTHTEKSTQHNKQNKENREKKQYYK